MKTISLKDFKHDGELINLENFSIPYEKLIVNPSLYLDKNKKYYFYCKNGVKSRKVVSMLELHGYNVIRVIN